MPEEPPLPTHKLTHATRQTSDEQLLDLTQRIHLATVTIRTLERIRAKLERQVCQLQRWRLNRAG